MSHSPTHRNTPARIALAQKLQELRSWPPFSREPDVSLRRPKRAQVMAALSGEQTLHQLLEQSTQYWDCLLEAQAADASTRGAEFVTTIRPCATAPLDEVFVRVLEPSETDGQADTLVLYCKTPASDREYATHIAPLWQRYQRDSQVSDDTAAQYREYLRLKQIYEPGTTGQDLA